MPRVHISAERGVKKSWLLLRTIRRAAAVAVEEERLPADAALSVLLTDDEGIRAVNKAYRNVDKPTDVLSFPANALKKPLRQAMAEGLEPERDRPGGRLFLGDIVLSVERAAAQAAEYGHTLKREAAFLTVHAVLHLAGYDHEQGGEEVMREKQRKALFRLQL